MNVRTDTLPIGCLFDGCHGYDYNAQRVIDLAKEYGWYQQEYEDDEDYEDYLQDDEQEATEYLEAFAPEGHWVGWHDGDFGVWSEDEE